MTELRKLYLADEDNNRTAGLDAMTDTLMTIDYAHHEIHSGSHYAVQHNASAGASVVIAFKTPAGTKKAHVVWEFPHESKCHVTVYEGRTWTTNTGTVVAPKNQNRDSSNTSMLLEDKTATPDWTAGGVLQDPTGLGSGSVISLIYMYTDKSAGDEGGKRHELVLKPDETYSFEMTSDDGNKGMQLRLYWYEHTDAT